MLDIYRRLVIKHLDMEAGNLFLNDIQIREFSNSRIDLPLLYFVGQYNDIDIITVNILSGMPKRRRIIPE